MPKFIVTLGELTTNSEIDSLEAVMINAAAPSNAACSALGRFEGVEYNDRLWVYPISEVGISHNGYEFVVHVSEHLNQ